MKQQNKRGKAMSATKTVKFQLIAFRAIQAFMIAGLIILLSA